MHKPLFLTVFLLAGCGGKLTCGKGTTEADGECISNAEANRDQDLDGDGFIGADDCNDEDADSFPGADERCDGVDNDCDGRVDEEDAIDATTFYEDADGDGYGNDEVTALACTAPEGMVEAGTDCDDENPGANPGATEIWYDGIDGNCDQSDDYDRDGDGFNGGPEGMDCDDDEPTAFPAAEEVCGDGIDNDCDGSLGPCGLNGDVDAASADAVFLGQYADDFAGASLAILGDASADGLTDLAIASPRWDAPTGANAGRVTVVSADLRGLVYTETGHHLLGESVGWLAGSIVRAAGDLNADGNIDVLVAEPGAPSGELDDDTGMLTTAQPWAGALHGVFGPVDSDVSLSSVSSVFRGSYTDHGLDGIAVVGDQNGDGKPELAIGMSRDNARGYDAGAVLVLPSPFVGEFEAEDGHRLGAAGPADRAGTAVAALGDVNGDGIDDLAVSAPHAESRPPSSPFGSSDPVLVDVGAVYIIHGPVLRDLYLDDSDGIHTGELAYDRVGGALAATGDLNGDGLADALIGASELDGEFNDQGGAYVIDGPADRFASLAGARLRLSGSDGSEEAGSIVDGAGDTDGDGVREILVGAPKARGGAGAVYLLRGNQSGTMQLSEAHAVFVGDAAGDWLGTAIAGGQDVNDDGLADILLGAPGNDLAGNNAGAAYLYLGQPR